MSHNFCPEKNLRTVTSTIVWPELQSQISDGYLLSCAVMSNTVVDDSNTVVDDSNTVVDDSIAVADDSIRY